MFIFLYLTLNSICLGGRKNKQSKGIAVCSGEICDGIVNHFNRPNNLSIKQNNITTNKINKMLGVCMCYYVYHLENNEQNNEYSLMKLPLVADLCCSLYQFTHPVCPPTGLYLHYSCTHASCHTTTGNSGW